MVDYQTQCETMLLEGQWDRAQQTALAWTLHPATGTDRDPRPQEEWMTPPDLRTEIRQSLSLIGLTALCSVYFWNSSRRRVISGSSGR